MFNNIQKKLTAMALVGMFTVCGVGLAAESVEAATHTEYHQNDKGHNPEPKHDVHPQDKHHANVPKPKQEESEKKYSEGERNTAAILGAVVGAVVAKNT